MRRNAVEPFLARDAATAEGPRVDKWLWAARFFKSRSLATAAIHAGHVRLNGQPPKPAQSLRLGDTLDVALGPTRWTIVTRALDTRRGPAAEAQRLYEETSESRARRDALRENLRMAPAPGSGLKGRPTKKARRLIHRFNESR
ncbi:MAG: RNA-binding S4 domain-containing protein [Candidatus Accumulibacter sp.]|jgi:ribosome-associated heat shock protein Hsp15|nr:RNA-binding S4 domain-containing protein [Accumulibacter sp.]